MLGNLIEVLAPRSKQERVSRNKFRYISSMRRADGAKGAFQIWSSRHKLDRRPTPKVGNYVSLKGTLYLRTGQRLTRVGAMKTTSNGAEPFARRSFTKTPPAAQTSPYKVDRRRPSMTKKPKRLSSGAYGDVLKETTYAQIRARSALAKSLATVLQTRFRTKNKRENGQSRSKSNKYCLYFNRFGRCSRGSTCPFIHDPERVALCTRFLRGKCQIKNCPFSHKLSKEKMPVCSYFLKGRCSRENCPYLHVNVGQSAEICPEFANGYCAAGEKCKKKHSRICPEFDKTGSCPRGRKCTLKHVTKGMKRTFSAAKVAPSSRVDSKQPLVKKSKLESLELDDRHLPMHERDLPAFISLSTNYSPSPQLPLNQAAQTSSQETTTGSIRIRPRFSLQDDCEER